MSEKEITYCTRHIYFPVRYEAVCEKCEGEKNLELNILRSRVEELERENGVLISNNANYVNVIEKIYFALKCDDYAQDPERLILTLQDELARLREMVDASSSALGRIYEIAYDWKPEPVPYCDDGGDMTMQPWDKSDPIPQEVNNG